MARARYCDMANKPTPVPAPLPPALPSKFPAVERMVPLDSIHLDPTNVRRHPSRNLEIIRGSLDEFGQVERLLVQKSSGRIIAGNGRYIELKAAGAAQVAVTEIDCDDVTAARLSIVMNRTGETAEWDDLALVKSLDAFKNLDMKLLTGVGWNDQEFDKLIRSVGDLTIASDPFAVAPAPPAPPAPPAYPAASASASVSSTAPTPVAESIEEDIAEVEEDDFDLLFRSPYPYFGAKSRVAGKVWHALGDVHCYIEPFFGSGAVFLNRPQPFDGVETVNDLDGFICNAWRAIKAAPDDVARFADWPSLENDLSARHIWLVQRKASLSERLEGDPDYFDAKIAGWWLWGMALWIGSGFCRGDGPWHVVEEDGVRKLIKRDRGAEDEDSEDAGQGVNRTCVHLSDAGQGVNRTCVHLSAGQGVNRKRVHLSDAESSGKAGCGEQGLYAWMHALSDRLRRVCVCCGDWTRICGGNSGDMLSHMVVFGTCGIFLDPPYADTAGRDATIYAHDDLQIAHAVRDWAVAHGDDPRFRIVLCGYEGEHVMPSSWRVVAWKTRGGYALMGDGTNIGLTNRIRERLWLSPHCLPIRESDVAPFLASPVTPPVASPGLPPGLSPGLSA